MIIKIEKFNINRIIKSGAKYDYDKAKWFNGEHIKKIDSIILINENKDEIIKGLSNEINEESIPELINLVRSFPRQALHARVLSFNCPKTQNEMTFEIPIPSDIQNLIKDIKKHS